MFINMSVVVIVVSLLIMALGILDSIQDGDSLISGIGLGAGFLFYERIVLRRGQETQSQRRLAPPYPTCYCNA